jgi:hypothetical protein
MKRILLAILFSLPAIAFAQKHHEIGVWGGVGAYKGDLNQKWVPDAKMIKPSAGIMYKYFFNPRVGIRAAASVVQITAADSLSSVAADRQRNLNFSSRLFEVQGGLEVNLLKIDIEKFKFTPYIYGGGAVFYGNPYTKDVMGEKFYLRNMGTEGQGLPGYPDRKFYPMVNGAFVFGGGLKAFVGKTVLVCAEVGLRYTSTDYIDDVSRSYVNLDTLRAYRGQKAADLAYRGNEKYDWDKNYPNYTHQRGDFKKNDWYWTAGVSVTVYFDAFGNAKRWIQTRCPRIFGK